MVLDYSQKPNTQSKVRKVNVLSSVESFLIIIQISTLRTFFQMQSIFKIQTTSSLTHEVESAFVYAFDILFTLAFILTCVIRDSSAAQRLKRARTRGCLLLFYISLCSIIGFVEAPISIQPDQSIKQCLSWSRKLGNCSKLDLTMTIKLSSQLERVSEKRNNNDISCHLVYSKFGIKLSSKIPAQNQGLSIVKMFHVPF